MKWAALFSQTGSEICNLSEQLGRYPDLVISDNTSEQNVVDPRIEFNCRKISWKKCKGLSAEEKINYYRDQLIGYDVITLHGWLNIIPPKICKEFKIYNGHPGLINYYPDLKGKDPQVRAYDRIGDYLYVGSVIHEVTEYIDCGRIICYDKVSNVHCETLDKTYKTLKQTSLNSWVDFFNNKHYNNL